MCVRGSWRSTAPVRRSRQQDLVLDPESARERGKTIGDANVADDGMLTMVLHLRDQDTSLRDIVEKLVVTRGAKKATIRPAPPSCACSATTTNRRLPDPLPTNPNPLAAGGTQPHDRPAERLKVQSYRLRTLPGRARSRADTANSPAESARSGSVLGL
ncbi:hypothetical protein [Embleya sp. NPDC050493]|uniref:hypothetical protein n=1 Tax=Embleya sp. NPDC050493 TaxID=3363989 RepID=UPI003797CFEC